MQSSLAVGIFIARSTFRNIAHACCSIAMRVCITINIACAGFCAGWSRLIFPASTEDRRVEATIAGFLKDPACRVVGHYNSAAGSIGPSLVRSITLASVVRSTSASNVEPVCTI